MYRYVVQLMHVCMSAAQLVVLYTVASVRHACRRFMPDDDARYQIRCTEQSPSGQPLFTSCVMHPSLAGLALDLLFLTNEWGFLDWLWPQLYASLIPRLAHAPKSCGPSRPGLDSVAHCMAHCMFMYVQWTSKCAKFRCMFSKHYPSE